METKKAVKEVESVAGRYWREFKNFAFKGNMIDLAVAVVIGAAFNDVINSMVKNLIMPIFEHKGQNGAYEQWQLGPVKIGAFLGDLLHFLIVALAVFIVIVKIIGAIVKRVGPSEPGEPTTKECPFCLSTIPLKAKKCAHCTADLPVTA